LNSHSLIEEKPDFFHLEEASAYYDKISRVPCLSKLLPELVALVAVKVLPTLNPLAYFSGKRASMGEKL
jgi:hypothetical protein